MMVTSLAHPLVVLPIRGFASGKSRLAPVLSVAERAALLAMMAAGVVRAARGLPVLVVSSAGDVSDWAAGLGLDRIDDPGSLDRAARAGLDAARVRRYSHIIVVHADLPRITTLDKMIPLPRSEQLLVVRSHRDSGTPVLTVPTTHDFRFSYGPGSFERHLHEANRLGLSARTVEDDELAADLDIPEDLDRFRSVAR